MNNCSFKYLCSCCNAILLVESEDVNIKFKENMNLYYTFRCPCCNIDNVIEMSLLPLSIRVLTLKKFKLSLKGKVFYERFNV